MPLDAVLQLTCEHALAILFVLEGAQRTALCKFAALAGGGPTLDVYHACLDKSPKTVLVVKVQANQGKAKAATRHQFAVTSRPYCACMLGLPAWTACPLC